jgi:hypothetical protein
VVAIFQRRKARGGDMRIGTRFFSYSTIDQEGEFFTVIGGVLQMPTYVCYECGRGIKRGDVLHYEPPILSIQLGADFPKAFHPKCYTRAEAEAAAALAVQVQS